MSAPRLVSHRRSAARSGRSGTRLGTTRGAERTRQAAAARSRRRDDRTTRSSRTQRRGLALDGGVLLAGMLLGATGLVMSYSSTAPMALEQRIPPLFLGHLGALALGVGLGTACLFVPLRTIRALALPAWAIAIALLLATDLFGVEVNGARRWLAIPGTGFRFQPVEIVKGATLIAVAAVVARREGKSELSNRRAAAAIAVVALPIALLVRQPDLGNALLIGVLAGLLLIAAGTPIRRLLLPAALSIAGVAAYVATHAYALRRITGFLDPWKEAQGSGFQLVQSFVAFGKGGLVGVGLGNGRQKLSYLPEGHTDFILALVAEELGLIGVLLVLGGFAALWVAGTRIARQSRDRFSLLLALGTTSLLTLPAWINAAVVMGLVPTKGLTLPFLSHGGTSLVACCAVLGVLLAVGRDGSRVRVAAPVATRRLRR